MDGNALFFDRRRHGEALALRAAEALQRGDFASAFPYADRLCRVAEPSAQNYLLRSEAARGAGFAVQADADLARAFDLNPTDRTVLRLVLTRGETQARRAAARALIEDPACDASVLRRAVDELFAAGERAVLVLQPMDGRGGRSGWAAWRAGISLILVAQRADSSSTAPLPPDATHFLCDEDCAAAALTFEPSDLRRVALMSTMPDSPSENDRELACWSAPPPKPPLARDARQAPLWVVVPVYEDFEATRACVSAAMAQLAETEARLVVIDDASPNAALRCWLDINAASGRLELIRNATNLGFAASVNRALAICRGGDIVLLNADTLPPSGVFARLAALARSAPNVGTLTPLSNNGETCSFPSPNASSPLPREDEVARLDALARQASGDRLIDIPNGVGFCLYITRACLDAVGPLPEIYGRGYYEDVEFCLRAREKGFRTLCAPGVYVGHAGSLSFGAEKRRLVMQNMQLLRSRFPDHEAECKAFLQADPLRAARAAIERLDPPQRPFRLLVAALGPCALEAEAEARRWASSSDAPAPLLCLYNPVLQRVALRGPEGEAPQSLAFSLRADGGLDDLRDWLRRLRLTGLTLYFSSTLPASLVTLCGSIDPGFELAIADLDWFANLDSPQGSGAGGSCAQLEGVRPCPACAGALSASGATATRLRLWQAAVSQSAAIRPLDRMSAFVAPRLFPQARILSAPDLSGPDPAARPIPPSGGRVLGLLSPQPDAAADSLVATLAHVLRRRNDPARLVVFGQCLDDLAVMTPGNVLVVGSVENADIELLIGPYGITELMGCSRTRFTGRLDALASAVGLARAGFDWSSGAAPFDPADLALDPRLCDRKTAELVADWLARRRSPSPSTAQNELEAAGP